MKKLLLALSIIIGLLAIYYIYYTGVFEKETVIELSYSVPLETSPDEINMPDIIDVKDAFRYLVNHSQKSIYIAGLYFTSKINWRIKRDLKRAIKRGVKVKFLLQDSKFSRNEFNRLKLSKYTNVEVRFINIAPLGKRDWGTFHNKYSIFDEKYAIVGSANFSYPAFNHNIEINALIVDKTIVSQLTRLFMQDFKYATYKILPTYTSSFVSSIELRPIFLAETAPREINSPDIPDVSDVIKILLKNAKKEINLEIYAFTSNETNYPLLYNLLKSASEKNIDVKLIVDSDTYNKNEYVKYAINRLKEAGLKIKKFNIDKLTRAEFSAVHSKLLIVDKKYVLLGSCNWSKGGMLENREIAIISSQTQFVFPLYRKFYKDWNSPFSEFIR